MVLGDDGGFVYQFSDTDTQYDGNNIASRHLTPVIDLQAPDKFKRWDKLSYEARERTSGNGGVKIRYRTGNFDTSDTGWTDLTQTLTSVWAEYDRYLNISSKKIQFLLDNASGADFEWRSYELVGRLLDDR
jgi:hypothetical protein